MKKKEIQELSFSKYLDLIGAEKIDMKNEWEFARFIANEIICVIYRNKRDRISFSNESAKKIYTAWEEGKKINIQSVKRKSLAYKFKQSLFKRDGNKCFYSDREMDFEEATIEHLIPLSKGGKNNLDNLVLCLEEENKKMADKPLTEKISYKIEWARYYHEITIKNLQISCDKYAKEAGYVITRV